MSNPPPTQLDCSPSLPSERMEASEGTTSANDSAAGPVAAAETPSGAELEPTVTSTETSHSLDVDGGEEAETADVPSFPTMRLGLCCIINALRSPARPRRGAAGVRRRREKGCCGAGGDDEMFGALREPVFMSRSCTVSTVRKQGTKVCVERATRNLADLKTMVEYCLTKGIRVLRLSSNIFPHATNPAVPRYSLSFAEPLLEEIGGMCNRTEMRLSMHPDHFTNLSSPNKDVVASSMRELEHHVWILESLHAPPDSVLVLHGGGVYGDKGEAMRRLAERLKGLEERIKRRIVLENDEKCYSPEDLLPICEEVNVPLVYDVLHDHVYRHIHKNDGDAMPGDREITDNTLRRIVNTWKRRGLRPKCHLSESDNSRRGKKGSGHPTITGKHSMFVNDIPKEIRKLCSLSNVGIDVMIEAKGKEEAIFRLYEKFPQLKAPCLNSDQIREVERAVKNAGSQTPSPTEESVHTTDREGKKVHFLDEAPNRTTNKDFSAQSISGDSTEPTDAAKAPIYISDSAGDEAGERMGKEEEEEEGETLGQLFDNVISSLSPSPIFNPKRIPAC